MPGRTAWTFPTMTSPFMPFHITPHAERLPTSSMRAPERLFPCMAVAMNFQTARTAERLAARAAHVPVLGLRGGKLRCGGRR